MTSNQRKIQCAFLIFSITLVGCTPTKPPTGDIDAATSALTAARQAGASTYAPLELRAAEDHLSQAKANIDSGDFDVAVRMARESQVDSELAAVKSRLGKDREQVQKQTRENAQLKKDLKLEESPAAQADSP